MMSNESPDNWYETLDIGQWLRPTHIGADEARFIKKALRLRKGSSVLDAPCGAGRIAFHMALAGCRVTGVDLRKVFINRARSRFRRQGLSGEFRVQDLRDIGFDNEFSGVFNWFGSFGYFSDADNAAVIAVYARALRRGGRLLIDQPNRERILRNFMSERAYDTVLLRTRWDADRQRVITRWIIRGVEDSRNTSSIRLYTPSEFRRMFEVAGLSVEAYYGSRDGGPFDRSSHRTIVVGRKA